MKRTTVSRDASSSSNALARGRVPHADAKSISFSATLLRPKKARRPVTWMFLVLPAPASAQLPSRGQTTVKGTLNGIPFQETLEPDGRGGHWLKITRSLRIRAVAEAGDTVTLDFAPVAKEPEPKVPLDLRRAIAEASAATRDGWSRITPVARRDFIQWITSCKRPETRTKRIMAACDMLAKGKRRPCCFDRSGMYGKNLSCPVADPG